MSTVQTHQRLHLVIAGHVDHGKSTVVGRLLADTGSLPEGKLEQVRELCARTAKPFEYAFLLDALKDERAQGITIDTARVFFKTATRDCILLDAPGHVEFLKNMVTGASRAEAAFLVIDAKEGIRENTRRHGYLAGMLGVRQLAVIVNKMDLVNWDKGVFDAIEREFRAFLRSAGVEPIHFIPICARDGDNLTRRCDHAPWYQGPTVLEQIDAFETAPRPTDRPFRMPVQDIYKFTAGGDDRRIVAGTIESGTLRAGEEVVFYPSGKVARVRSLETFSAPTPAHVEAGQAVGFTLDQQLYLTRGELATRATDPKPMVNTRLRASLFWLGRAPLVPGKDYILRMGTARAPMRVETIHQVLDADALDHSGAPSTSVTEVGRHTVADVTLRLTRAIAFDLADDLAATSRFVVVDDYEIRGGGIIREALPDQQAWARDKVLQRNWKWEGSFIPAEERAARAGQRPMLLLLTGPGEDGAQRKQVARELEARLFAAGRQPYFLGFGNMLYGLDADLERDRDQRAEHMRRLAEVANLMLDAGTSLIVTAAELTPGDLEVIIAGVSPERIATAWLGADASHDLQPDLQVTGPGAVEALERFFDERGRLPDGSLPRLEPCVLWFTGLSGAGKSTIADQVAEDLRGAGYPVERLDGDAVRDAFPQTGFDRASRNEHLRRIGFLAGTLERHGVFVVASFISPYADGRDAVRAQCRRFVEVYVNTPLDECERRDVKGLYAKARRGEVTQFTGVSDPYEPPSRPELTLETTNQTPEGAALRVLEFLRQQRGD